MDTSFPKLTPDSVSQSTMPGAQTAKANDSWLGAIFRRKIDCEKPVEADPEERQQRGMRHVAQVHRAFR